MKKGDSSGDFTAEHPIIARKIKKSLDISVKEGSMAAASSGFGSTYLAPFALALGATTSQMGLLGAFATFFPGLAQLLAIKRIGKESRKTTLLTSVILTILMSIPIILTGFMFLNGVNVIWLVIVLIGLYYVFWGYGVPAWFSWMGSLVPADHRGEYFSRRRRSSMLSAIITMVVAALILDFAKKYNNFAGETTAYVIFAFSLLFILSMLFRIMSVSLLRRQYEPHLIVKKRDQMNFWTFLKNAPKTAFGKFTLFNFAFRVAVGIASPFFVVYILRELNFSYLMYIVTVVSGMAFQIMFLKVHGKISDRFGNIALMRISSIAASSSPLTYIFVFFIPSPIFQILYIVFVAEMFNGFGWSGYNLATNNYVYDSISGARREYALSYMNVFVGVGSFIGASIGAWIAIYNPVGFSVILIIFIISFICRILISLIGVRKLEEVRKVKKFDPNFVIHEIDPIRATMSEVHHLQHLGDRVIHHI